MFLGGGGGVGHSHALSRDSSPRRRGAGTAVIGCAPRALVEPVSRPAAGGWLACTGGLCGFATVPRPLKGRGETWSLGAWSVRGRSRGRSTWGNTKRRGTPWSPVVARGRLRGRCHVWSLYLRFYKSCGHSRGRSAHAANHRAGVPPPTPPWVPSSRRALPPSTRRSRSRRAFCIALARARLVEPLVGVAKLQHLLSRQTVVRRPLECLEQVEVSMHDHQPTGLVVID